MEFLWFMLLVVVTLLPFFLISLRLNNVWRNRKLVRVEAKRENIIPFRRKS